VSLDDGQVRSLVVSLLRRARDSHDGVRHSAFRISFSEVSSSVYPQKWPWVWEKEGVDPRLAVPHNLSPVRVVVWWVFCGRDCPRDLLQRAHDTCSCTSHLYWLSHTATNVSRKLRRMLARCNTLFFLTCVSQRPAPSLASTGTHACTHSHALDAMTPTDAASAEGSATMTSAMLAAKEGRMEQLKVTDDHRVFFSFHIRLCRLRPLHTILFDFANRSGPPADGGVAHAHFRVLVS
jgi:hypothetical protein